MVFFRLRLHRAARRFAAHGWPVTPGACLRGDRFDCGHPGCPTITCHPVPVHGAPTASTDPALITQWWRHAPHSVLLPTGAAFDALELAAPLGALLTGSPRWVGALRGPVAVMPTGRWLFLLRPGTHLPGVLDGELGVVHHGRGSWVPAPPTRLAEGPVRWTVSPSEVRWRLPAYEPLHELLVTVVRSLPERHGARRPRSSS